jgi:chemotaxis protein CheX
MPSHLILPVKADTAAARGLLEKIRNLQGGALQIDAQNCQTVGALCANILVAAQQSWRRSGHEFKIKGSSEITNDLQLLGVGDLLLDMEPLK